MHDINSMFAFEADFAQSLQFIPMAVRFKLDQCGVKLSLRQWTGLTLADRHQLLQWRCETAQQRRAYRQLLVGLIQSRAGETAVDVAVESHPSWADTSQVPEQISARFIALGLAAPALQKWSTLTPLERYALVKLCRPAHGHTSLLPAMREFGLVRSDAQVDGT